LRPVAPAAAAPAPRPVPPPVSSLAYDPPLVQPRSAGAPMGADPFPFRQLPPLPYVPDVPELAAARVLDAADRVMSRRDEIRTRREQRRLERAAKRGDVVD